MRLLKDLPPAVRNTLSPHRFIFTKRDKMDLEEARVWIIGLIIVTVFAMVMHTIKYWPKVT